MSSPDSKTDTDPSIGHSSADRSTVVLVTGMSGAGKSTVLKTLEDLGFEAVDNLPLHLMGTMLHPSQPDLPALGSAKPLALGVDIRTRDFSLQAFREQLDRLRGPGASHRVRAIFMDCDDDELRRRYTETRRKHPLALDRAVEDGIALERRLVTGLIDMTDITIDTTVLAPGELKSILEGHFGGDGQAGLSVFVTSFSYRRGIPRQADLVFDVRFLQNPHYIAELKPLTGETEAVAAYVEADPKYAPFFDNLTRLLAPLLPAYRAEGKKYLTIAVGCTGGKHRSVLLARRLATWLTDQGQRVRLDHRDMPKNTEAS